MDEFSNQRRIKNRTFARPWVVALVVLGCSGARLDPEKNQALTFITSGPSDAGVEPPMLPMSRKAVPSQPVPGASQEQAEAASGSQTPAAEPIRCTQDPPDPKPTSTRDWFAFEFKFVQGAAHLQSAHRVQTAKPRDAVRVVGRYAVELWIGCELLDRVRFSFPLQAAEGPANTGPRHALHEQPSLTARGDLRATVLVPFSDRATRAELVDRSAGTREALAWPPDLNAGKGEPKQQVPERK
jgi:hypothetical protein